MLIFFLQKLDTLVGMGMANQLELISVYACCSTRATKGSMEGGEKVPYGRQISGQKLDHNYTKLWILGSKNGRSKRQVR